MKIAQVSAIEVLDSRGKPTVRAFVKLEDGSIHSSSVPSGASTGKYEALELRDGDASRHMGQGVSKAVGNINTKIAPAIQGMSVLDPNAIDTKMIELDGSENKSNLGANAILAVSQAAVKAGARASGKKLWQFIHDVYDFPFAPAFPRLMVNVVNGGKHANWNFDIQEFILITTDTLPSKSTRVAAEIFHSIGKNIKAKKMSTLVGDEGGYSPALSSNEEAFELIINSAKDVNYTNTQEYVLAMDAAASEFFSDGQYVMKKDGRVIDGKELLSYYLSLREKYHVYSYEDVFDQDDWTHFSDFMTHSHGDFLVVGDDLTVTNPKVIQKGIELKAANAVIIKPNQIGSIKETIEAIKLAKSAGWKTAVAHRSGETEDSFIADLAYGTAADFIKTGSMSRSDRLAKYNRLLEIEFGY